jgi:hypothetical protein
MSSTDAHSLERTSLLSQDDNNNNRVIYDSDNAMRSQNSDSLEYIDHRESSSVSYQYQSRSESDGALLPVSSISPARTRSSQTDHCERDIDGSGDTDDGDTDDFVNHSPDLPMTNAVKILTAFAAIGGFLFGMILLQYSWTNLNQMPLQLPSVI